MARDHATPRIRRPATGRRSPLITTRLALQQICSSPATQASVNWLVVSICSRALVSGLMFVLTAVRVLLWKGWLLASAGVGFGRVFMNRSVST